ncbi:Alpha/Beta hydrolase protein [Gigaspora rosea]|uniref:Alpha/Beta hydrolase protein n=1 Tax=Gigaspora rosea TaxID=44941 RepID=A0A397UE95_9GLOM|nr:Alpha/Beta hydrolase protein [Gigaspora rosea]
MSETCFFEQQDGSKIAYKILKSANAKNEVPLVMIMGLSNTKEFYFGLDEELAKYQQVIVFDNRGIGESTVASPNDPMTLELLAQDTIGLIKHLGIKRFNLLGEAMGVVQIIDKLYQSASSIFPKTVQEAKDEFLKRERDPNLAKYLLENPDKLEKVAELVVNSNPRRPLEIMKRQWEANKKCDLTPRLKEIQTPTLIIHGESNTMVLIEGAEILDREIPNTKLLKIPNVGHA